MTDKVGGQSQPQEYLDEPYCDAYEDSRKSYYGEKGIGQSGMKGK